MTIQFKWAEFFDAQDIYEITDNAFIPNPYSLAQIENELKNPNYRYFIALEGKRVVGFVSYIQSIDTLDLTELAVHTDYQRRGIAQNLIQKSLEFLKPFEALYLEVRSSNFKAINLYTKLGFKKLNMRKNYYSNPEEDAIVMELKKDVVIISFESSADETSVAVVKNGNQILSNIVATQINSHQRFGGIVPEVASRHHLEWINIVLNQALKEANITNPHEQLDAVAATYGPGLVGSLLVGLMAGKTFAQINDLPFIGVNHLAGHLLAANFNRGIIYPAMALMVSGGHTELVLMEKPGNFKIIGETLDDAAGEAFDKVGRVLGLNYPAGKEMQELSKLGTVNIDFPIAKTTGTYDFSFSGIKSAVINYLHHEEQLGNSVNKNDVIASFQKAVVDALIQKTDLALSNYDVKMLVLGGGVAANEMLRNKLEEITSKHKIELNMVPIRFSGDNAAMIGAAGYQYFIDDKFSDLSLDTKPNLDFESLVDD
ncbi:MAG: tRNA (adenosine(37)-N6)-threonylcarbamoyltransferase complex transferase subunit TsaD [Lactobacillaceae bacterium]|jgi:N6-L-threonylcarbamoyladenine synthase|nr:tRNA (adenosine(37)-N6)-threonylcarbamoyltransferase complex transferase subunit TsaD [Lactobacillaceae bacterium]